MKFSKALIKGFFKKEEKSVRVIYNETYRLLFHIAFNLLHHKEDSEDVVSETFKKMFETNETLIDTSNFISYMAMICKNLSLDIIKRRKFASTEFDDNHGGTNDIYSSELLNLVTKTLTEDEFNVFMYRAYYELSFKEIASIVDKNESRCRGIYFEAKKKLNKKKDLFL